MQLCTLNLCGLYFLPSAFLSFQFGCNYDYYYYLFVCFFMQSVTRLGVSLAGTINYTLELNGSIHTCADKSICGPTFQTCLDIYNSWPKNYIEIYAWYQIRNVRWCSGILGIVSGILGIVSSFQIREKRLSVAINDHS